MVSHSNPRPDSPKMTEAKARPKLLTSKAHCSYQPETKFPATDKPRKKTLWSLLAIRATLRILTKLSRPITLQNIF